MVKIYHNPRCSKSRQTLQLLAARENDFEIIEYLKNPPNFEELKSLLQKLELSPHDLIRRGEEVYKQNFKGKSLTDEQWIKTMVKHPELIERPIVVKGDRAILGRPPENIKALY